MQVTKCNIQGSGRWNTQTVSMKLRRKRILPSLHPIASLQGLEAEITSGFLCCLLAAVPFPLEQIHPLLASLGVLSVSAPPYLPTPLQLQSRHVTQAALDPNIWILRKLLEFAKSQLLPEARKSRTRKVPRCLACSGSRTAWHHRAI